MRSKWWGRAVAAAVAAATMMLTTAMPAAAADATSGSVIRLLYVEWDSCVAATNVAKIALEDAGYRVQTMSVVTPAMYAGLASRSGDATVCAWLPKTHHEYYEKTKDQLVDIGHNATNVIQGLVVPDYVKITSIPQLATRSAEFGNRIVGIDPGSGLMVLLDNVVKHYKLPEKVIAGTDATMTAALADAISHHQPIVVTGWKPHWMWARWKLHFLEDPDDVFGYATPDNIDTLVRKGFQQDQPKAYGILSRFRFSPDDRAQVMLMNRKRGADADPMTGAQEWVKAHPKQLAEWLGK